jgi:hypothetical protein
VNAYSAASSTWPAELSTTTGVFSVPVPECEIAPLLERLNHSLRTT